jgi:hypothetical protein
MRTSLYAYILNSYAQHDANLMHHAQRHSLLIIASLQKTKPNHLYLNIKILTTFSICKKNVVFQPNSTWLHRYYWKK